MNARSRRFALAGLAILAVLLLVALAAPLVAPYDPNERVGRPFSAPSAAHLLGTNDVGHDLLSELIHGTRISLLVGTVAALAATVVGALVGVSAGYCRGRLDTALMRIVDVVLALPVLPLTIVIGVFAGPGLRTQILVISSVIWAGVARELRAQVLSLRERDYLQALRAMGAGPAHVLSRHVLPAVAPLAVPQFVLATKSAILLEASLAFLGLGDITAKSWGTMLSLAHSRSAFLTDAWRWWVLPPGLAIAVTVLAFALLGYALEERARPSLRERGQRPAAPAHTPADAPVDLMAHATADTPAEDASHGDPPLQVRDLSISYCSENDPADTADAADPADATGPAVSGVSLTVAAGELVGLVGESGSGKSTIAAAAIGLLPPAARTTGGTVRIQGRDLAAMSPARLRELRGDRVALIPQEAMSALNPVLTVGEQLAEAVRAHRPVTRAQARARAAELLALVGLDPARAGDYPHQFSGGMRQRVVIAIALANDPAVVIADEPTSGLDVLVAAEVLALLAELRHRLDLALLVVSHDLAMIERVADRIAVMEGGRLVEIGPAEAIVTAPRHPYTRALVEATSRLRPPTAQVSR